MRQPERIRIVKLLFPALSLIPEGSFWDRYGIDGFMEEKSVQCKHDTRIASSQNIWHEIYEKSALNDRQAWRKSPGIAELYIFTTETNLAYVGYLVKIDTLARLEQGRTLKVIYPNGGAATSMGFLLPLKDFGTDIHETVELKEDYSISRPPHGGAF